MAVLAQYQMEVMMLMIMMFAAAVDAIIMKIVAAATAAVVTSAVSAVVVVVLEIVVLGGAMGRSSATMLKSHPQTDSECWMMYDDNGSLLNMMITLTDDLRCDAAGPSLCQPFSCWHLSHQMSC